MANTQNPGQGGQQKPQDDKDRDPKQGGGSGSQQQGTQKPGQQSDRR